MKSVICATALLMGASSVLASEAQQNAGVLTLLDSVIRGGAEQPSSCTDGFTLTVTAPIVSNTPDFNFDFYTFCSDFLQPTVTVIKTSYVTASTTVTAATATVTSASTSTVYGGSSTVTSLCPVPSSVNPICGSPAWGYSQHNIYFIQPEDAAGCHQLCLQNPNCDSFQVQNSSYPTPQCNLYNSSASANDTIVGASSPFLFYDWDCPDYLPAACGPSSVAPAAPSSSIIGGVSSTRKPQTYTLPSGPGHRAPIATAPARLAERVADTAAYATLPSFLAPFGSSSVTNICHCIVTSPSPTVEVQKTTKVSRIATASVTVTKVVGTVVTTTVGGGTGIVTVVSSVS